MKKTKKQVVEHYSCQNLEDAITKVKELNSVKPRKFIESVDVAINLGIESNQLVKGSVLLPNGSGKKPKIIVVTPDENKRLEALQAGAIEAGFDDLINKIDAGFLDFDCCIASPDSMQKLSKVAKKLGPRGLMPSPKNGTVTTDIKRSIAETLKGRADFKNDKAGIVHCMIGKIDFDAQSLVQNIEALIKAVKDARPEGAKGKFIKSFYLNTTMGKSVAVDTAAL